MTAKRFEINNDMDFNDKIETYELNGIVDNDNQTFYFIADSLENVQLFVKRLNELYKDNRELQIRYDAQKRFFGQLNSDYNNYRLSAEDCQKQLKKENEQLKNVCKKLINEVKKRRIRVTISDEYKELSE